jgi:ABC-type branched-subunit amino acid transport system substrate-binding protein
MQPVDRAGAVRAFRMDDRKQRLVVMGDGGVETPDSTADFSSLLLQAQASGARVLALNAAGGNATAMKQAVEFGLAARGMTIVPMSFQNVDIAAVGLPVAQGDLVLTSFFEDESEAARKWSDAFFARRHAMPSQIQAGVYSAVRHYLQGHGFGRLRHGHGADEGDAGLRRLCAEGRDSRRSADGARSVFGAG